MRGVVLLLALAAAFVAAALWERQRLERRQEELAVRLALADGVVADTSSGLVEAGRAVVVVGRPSGAEPVAAPGLDPRPPPPAPQPKQVEPQPEPASEALADFELLVQPGQTLSQIARAHYQRHDALLLQALARYNGLPSVDDVRAGQKLHLPPLERLLGG